MKISCLFRWLIKILSLPGVKSEETHEQIYCQLASFISTKRNAKSSTTTTMDSGRSSKLLELVISLSFYILVRSAAANISISSSSSKGSSNGSVVIYWGTYSNESSLRTACESGNYGIVVLSFLSVFGNGTTPRLELADHCDGIIGCATVGLDVKVCQSKGVKVFLSLGGAEGNYSIESKSDAAAVASYLWNNFLGGNSSDRLRPLGPDVVLDGIDFDMEKHNKFKDGYAELAKQIKQVVISNKNNSSRAVYLSAAPQCPFPDEFLGSALETGLFDYVWVQFYNNPDCHYDPDHKSSKSLENVVAAWNRWEKALSLSCKKSKTSTLLFVGLPASLSAATDLPSTKDGYMPARVLLKHLLPRISRSPSYGGIMLWSYYYDMIHHDGRKVPYSTTIRNKI